MLRKVGSVRKIFWRRHAGARVLAVPARGRGHALELTLYVLQQVEEPGALAYRALNLTLLEIIYYTLSAHSPTALYAAPTALPAIEAALDPLVLRLLQPCVEATGQYR